MQQAREILIILRQTGEVDDALLALHDLILAKEKEISLTKHCSFPPACPYCKGKKDMIEEVAKLFEVGK